MQSSPSFDRNKSQNELLSDRLNSDHELRAVFLMQDRTVCVLLVVVLFVITRVGAFNRWLAEVVS